MPTTLKIVVAEDHKIVVDGIKSILETQQHLKFVGHADNEADVLYLVQQHNPDVLILDLNLNSKSGFEILEKITRHHKNTQVVILTMYNEPAFVRKAKALGAKAYLLKNYNANELLDIINSLSSKPFQVSAGIASPQENPQLFNSEFASANNLSPKEKEIIILVAKGLSSKQMAEQLCLSTHTIDTHRRNLLKKLNLPNTASLVRFAYENNLVTT